MKINHEWPDGTGDDYKSILDKDKAQWKEDWGKLSLEEKQRHVKYLSDLYDYTKNPQFFGKEEMKIILENMECDILLIPGDFHEEYDLNE